VEEAGVVVAEAEVAEAAVEGAAVAEAAVEAEAEEAEAVEVEAVEVAVAGKEEADRAAGVDLAVAARSSCLLATTPGLCRRKQSSDGGGRLHPR
jgi:hypothetical protein